MELFRDLDFLDLWRNETVEKNEGPENDHVQSRIQHFEAMLTLNVKGRIVETKSPHPTQKRMHSLPGAAEGSADEGNKWMPPAVVLYNILLCL